MPSHHGTDHHLCGRELGSAPDPYRTRIYNPISGDRIWYCDCPWGERHSNEPNNECAHALAAEYYAARHTVPLVDLVPQAAPDAHLDDYGDPFEGL